MQSSSRAPYPHLMSTLFALASRREGGDFRDTLNNYIAGDSERLPLTKFIGTDIV